MEIVHIDISYITLKPQAKLVYFFSMHRKMNVQTLFYNAGFTSKLKQPRLRIIIFTGVQNDHELLSVITFYYPYY